MTNVPHPLPPPRRKRWKSVLLSLLIFAFGLICGVGLTALVAVNRIQFAIQHPEAAPARITTLLQRRLDLNPSQAETIRSVLERRQRNLQSIRRDVWPRVRAELDATYGEIARHLDDPQRQKWQETYHGVLARWLPPDAPEDLSSTPPASPAGQTGDAPARRTPPPGE